MNYIALFAFALFALIQNSQSHAAYSQSEMLAMQYNATLRQVPFLEWIASIFRPPAAATTTTTTPKPQRQCPDCTCGTINTFRRIVGGQETEVNEYPWMALLLSNGNFFCGGSLINDLYVASAAHCLDGVNQGLISVRLLEHNRKNSSTNIIERRAAWIGIHERYNRRTYDNDIALIRFAEPVKFSSLLRPVCMPDEGNDFAGDDAVVTGWGALSEGGPVSDTLQEVRVPVYSQEACRMSSYGASAITDNMLCAGYDEGGKDSCQGDSGGPLHVAFNDTDSTQYQLAGIVSWGIGCARPRSPGVYARVTRYLDWLAKRTGDGCGCDSEEQKKLFQY